MKPRRRTLSSDRTTEGLVLSPTARHAKVFFDGNVVRCLYANVLKDSAPLDTRPVAAGDRVVVRVADTGDAFVESVLPRKSVLARQHAGSRRQVMVANADRVLIVTSATEPIFLPRLVDRMLVACEAAGLPAVITITKVDLLTDRSAILEAASIWSRLGYDVRLVSPRTGEGIDELRPVLLEGITVAAGQSGVGKSSLLTAFEPSLKLSTATVSEHWGRGRHTTTAATLHRFMAGWLCDTPGIRSFGLAGLAPTEIAVRFRDFQPFIDSCRFNSCTHVHEPECAVKEAVALGKVHPARMDSYLRMIGAITGDDESESDSNEGSD